MRLRNLLTPAELPYGLGQLVPYEAPSEYDSGDYASALRRALACDRLPRLAARNGTLVDGRRHGVGIGCFVESSGAGPFETARIVVRRPGRVELYTGCASSGQGIETWMAQILADALGVPSSGSRVFHGTTSFVHEGYGTYHSRAVVVGGSAVKVAAATLADQLVALAAARAGSIRPSCSGGGDGPSAGPPASRPCSRWPRSPPRRRPRPRPRSRPSGRFRPGKLTYTYGAQVAHVAVDPETGAVEVLRLVAVEDVGPRDQPDARARAGARRGGAGARRRADRAARVRRGRPARHRHVRRLRDADRRRVPDIDAITLEDAPSR